MRRSAPTDMLFDRSVGLTEMFINRYLCDQYISENPTKPKSAEIGSIG